MSSPYRAKNLKIIIHPNPILRAKSRPLSIEEIKKPTSQSLLADMALTMTNKDGAGLAAPQIGQNIRMIVVATDSAPLFMINPRLSKKSWSKETAEEGCLSVLNDQQEIVYAPIARHKKISCLYLDQNGQEQKIKAEGLLARVIQHEIDHLDGILFLDYLSEKEQKTIWTKTSPATHSNAA